MKKRYEDRTLYSAFSSDEEYLELLEAAIEKSEIGFLIADAEGRVIKVNNAQIDITKQDATYNLGRNMREVQLDDNSPSGTVLVLDTLEPVKIEQNLPTGRSYLVYSNPYFDDKGELKYVISNLIDAAEIRETKESLEKVKDDNLRLSKQLQELQSQMESKNPIIHQSKIMRQMILLCNKIAQFDSGVLIQGESGVGKERVAEYIVAQSNRHQKPFVKINCAAIPERLIESELFGYEPGSFTNAGSKGKKGLLEYADEGTILLDEISELELSLQAKILRFLQEGEFYRIGGVKPIKTDVRILAATNDNLEERVKEGLFREDLFYRLNVIPVIVPPLRERKEDIPVLVGHLINKFNEKHDMKKRIELDAIGMLKEFPFYGNVRELQNTIERVLVLSESEVIGVKEIVEFMKGVEHEPSSKKNLGLKELLYQHEREILKKYVSEYKNQNDLSKALKISQSSVSRKLSEHQLG